jgi:hypothetical protein
MNVKTRLDRLEKRRRRPRGGSIPVLYPDGEYPPGAHVPTPEAVAAADVVLRVVYDDPRGARR